MEQLRHVDVVRPDAFDRRDDAVEYVVEAVELGRALDRQQVER